MASSVISFSKSLLLNGGNSANSYRLNWNSKLRMQ